MDKIIHKISKSEIDYGILALRKFDGTNDFFKTFPERFEINLRSIKLQERKISIRKIWIGYTQMKQFEPGETVEISKQGNVIIVK